MLLGEDFEDFASFFFMVDDRSKKQKFPEALFIEKKLLICK